MKRKIVLLFLALFIISALASCTSDKVSISYATSGGVLPNDAPTSYKEGSAPDFNKIVPELKDFDFDGWYIDSEFKIPFSVEAVEGSEITLYAKWSAKGVAISYELNGGECTGLPAKHAYGTCTSLESFVPTKANYTFGGWYSDSAYENKIAYISESTESAVTVYAKWIPQEFFIIYELNGGKCEGLPAKHVYGARTSLEKFVPEKNKYDFDGWYLDADFKGEKITYISESQSNIVTVYAKWEPKQYTISYELDGGVCEGLPTKHVYGARTSLEKFVPERANYDFGGWYLDEGFNDEISFIYKSTAKEVTVYAKWIPHEYAINYELNGGECEGLPSKHAFGIRTSLDEFVPEKQNFDFVGWYTKPDFEGEKITYIDESCVQEITVYAKWGPGEPKKISEIPNLSRGYFGEGYDTIVVDLTKYVNPNGRVISYSVTSSDTDFATAEITENTLSIKLKSATGSSLITLKVLKGTVEWLTYEFTVSPKIYTKITCVGDSLTESTPSYPQYLRQIIGNSISVGNYGKSGASVSSFVNNQDFGSYVSSPEYQSSLKYAENSELLLIMFGTNDATKVVNGEPIFDWSEVEPAYRNAYKELINSYKSKNPNIEVVIITTPPTVDGNGLSISNEILETYTYPIQLSIAEELGVKVIDFRAYLKSLPDGYESLYRDGIHFNEQGAELFAQFVAKYL